MITKKVSFLCGVLIFVGVKGFKIPLEADYVSKDKLTYKAEIGPSIYEEYNYCQAKYPSISTYKPMEGSTLVFLQGVIRHGDRTPIQSYTNDTAVWNECGGSNDVVQLYPNGLSGNSGPPVKIEIAQPKAGERTRPNIFWKGNCKDGQLTDKGKSQHNILGENVREIYVDMLKYLDKYLSDGTSIRVRTTDVWRTQHSAQSFIQGLYPPYTRGDKVVVPLSHYPRPLENMRVNLEYCPRIRQIFEKIKSSKKFKKYLRRNKKKMKQISSVFGEYKYLDRKMKDSWFTIMDQLNTLRCHNKPLPCSASSGYCATKEDAELALKNAIFENQIYRHNKEFFNEVVRLTAGTFMHELLDEVNMVIEQDKLLNNQALNKRAHQKLLSSKERLPKFSLYSGHDETISSILAALKVPAPLSDWPPYASSVFFEVWRSNSDNLYYMRVIYNGEVLGLTSKNSKQQHQTISCDLSKCPLVDYISYLNALLPRNVSSECLRV
ncbi:Counting factor 60 [Zancudomyces culisetae]|uniref:Counting factor 60 n=1 Tax=Zancudomyces culisetae TaxID=1213189 RepID=A0A1R1PRM3_ZANCU|nr:Counting factor 60 [Zancudomyces culisetae]|eukprot:OMH83532.1 Counting factor 60 [Zancudomyces culisetae]